MFSARLAAALIAGCSVFQLDNVTRLHIGAHREEQMVAVWEDDDCRYSTLSQIDAPTHSYPCDSSSIWRQYLGWPVACRPLDGERFGCGAESHQVDQILLQMGLSTATLSKIW